MRHQAGHDGFTLLELMIAVLLLGLMAGAAIPNFMSYQARSRRTEAFSNLSAIERLQSGYFAEADDYAATDNSFPDPAAHNTSNGGDLGIIKMPWDAASASAFAEVGWAPEGRIFYAYEIASPNSAGFGCACTLCFTASAFGDVDGDGQVSAVMLAKPDAADGVTACGSLDGTFGPPTTFNEVAINGLGDDY